MSDYGVDVSILPALVPTVEQVLAVLENAVVAWEALSPHLAGAFGSMASNWSSLTDAQRAAFVERCPNLVTALGLRRRMEALLAQMPDVEV